MKSHHTISLIFLIPGFCFSQQTKVRLHADRTAIAVGERIKLSLEADIPESEPIRFFTVDTIAHFEFISKEKIDTVNTSGGTVIRQQLVITSFDSGQFVIPAFILDETAGIQTDSITVTVSYSDFDPSQAYHDVRDIIEVDVKEEKTDWLLYMVGAAAIIFTLLFIFLSRKKRPKQIHVPAVDPYAEALKQAEELNGKQLAPKEYYTGLTDIFREYIAKRRHIHSLQNTTDGLVVQLRSVKLQQSLFDELAKALRLADFVKFAKYQPSADDDAVFYNTIITAIKQIEEDHKKMNGHV